MSIFVTLFTLALAVLALASPNFLFLQPVSEELKKAAIGWIGFVVGYWLK
jgi:hypothetical protein